MRLAGTYENINSSRESSCRFFFFCSLPIFSGKNRTSADVKTPFFALPISVTHLFICGLPCKKYCIGLSEDLRLFKVVGIFWFRLA